MSLSSVPTCDKFDANRFLANTGLSKSPSFRPFGGGTTYCAGRHVARRELLTFVALMVYRYDIETSPANSREANVAQSKTYKLTYRSYCITNHQSEPTIGN